MWGILARRFLALVPPRLSPGFTQCEPAEESLPAMSIVRHICFVIAVLTVAVVIGAASASPGTTRSSSARPASLLAHRLLPFDRREAREVLLRPIDAGMLAKIVAVTIVLCGLGAMAASRRQP
jgi:hypothetical protein